MKAWAIVSSALAAGTRDASMPARLRHREYAVDIQHAQDLRGYDVITSIAKAPAHIKGVMNLRGGSTSAYRPMTRSRP